VPPDWGQPKYPGGNNLNPTHSICPVPLTGVPCPVAGQIRVNNNKCVVPCTKPGEVMTPDGVCCVDLHNMDGGPPQAQLVRAPKFFTFSAASIGQVFGVAIDDASRPNVYAAATSAYGLPIVAPGADDQAEHIALGAPKAAFMPGLWGPQGGPGLIWKMDGLTGQVRSRVPGAVQRSSRCAAEPGPSSRLGPPLCSASRRKSGALRFVRGTKETNLAPIRGAPTSCRSR
jgi:hypothetical protein